MEAGSDKLERTNGQFLESTSQYGNTSIHCSPMFKRKLSPDRINAAQRSPSPGIPVSQGTTELAQYTVRNYDIPVPPQRCIPHRNSILREADYQHFLDKRVKQRFEEYFGYLPDSREDRGEEEELHEDQDIYERDPPIPRSVWGS